MTDRQAVAVIAGGSAGVGRAAARAFAREGWRVAILARGAERVASAEEELAGLGPAARGIVCNVADAEAVRAAAQEIERELGPIEVWVNSAMLTTFSPFAVMTAHEFDAIVDTTFIGSVNGARAALEVMGPRDRGRIVMVGSGLAYRAVPLQSAYCASKHAMVGFTASLRSELIAEGSSIGISMVQLPALNTPQFDWARNRMRHKPQPAPPIYAPEVAARAILRAAKDAPRELLVGSSVLGLVLGDAIAPGWLDRKLADDAEEAQQSDEREPGDRADNLDAPLDTDVAAAGRFSSAAKDKGVIVDAGRARRAAAAALVGVGALAGVALAAAF